MNITGRTKVYGILADPIHHVKTPQVMHAVFQRRGIDGVLIPMHVPPAGLASMMAGLREMQNFGGFIATVPHKPAMLEQCDEISELADLTGAVNCVRRAPDGRMIGTMLDGLGFTEGLKQAGIMPEGKAVLLAGAGGAASAIAIALAVAGIRHLTITNRTSGKAEVLAERVRMAKTGISIATADPSHPAGSFDLLVNATALGMNPDDLLPIATDEMHAGQTVAEVIMEPAETPLLTEAASRGCQTHPGLPMLEQQIELMARHMGALQ